MKNLFFIVSFYSVLKSQYLDAVQINIYPEYYYSGVMVEMEAILEKTTENQKMIMTLPAHTDSVFVIKGIPSPDNDINPLPVESNGDFSSVTFDIKEPQFRLFVFYNPFEKGANKFFSFTVGANMEMKKAHASIQVPMTAEDFKLSIQEADEEKDQHGITIKNVHLGDIKAGAVSTISAFYKNPSGLTTIEYLRSQLDKPEAIKPDQPATHEKPKRYTLLLWEPLAILGVLFAIIGYMFYYQQKTQKVKGKNYCSSCGKQIKPEDKFCSNCGAKIT